MKLGELLKLINADYIQIYDVDDSDDFQQSLTREQLYGDPILDANVVEINTGGAVEKSQFDNSATEEEVVYPLRLGYTYSAFTQEEEPEDIYNTSDYQEMLNDFLSGNGGIPNFGGGFPPFNLDDLSQMSFVVHPDDIKMIKELAKDPNFVKVTEQLGLGPIWDSIKDMIDIVDLPEDEESVEEEDLFDIEVIDDIDEDDE